MDTTTVPGKLVRKLPYNWLMRIVNKWVRGQYYGKLIISFENGRITHANEGRNRKPNDDDDYSNTQKGGE